MEIKKLKQYILDNKKIEYILTELGCHHIHYHTSTGSDNYYQCANVDGDNLTAIVVYENSSLYCINHTRNISDKEDTDLLDLVMFIKQLRLFDAIKYLCDILGLEYYEDEDDNIPESIKITQMLIELNSGTYIDDEKSALKPIDEKILSYYKPYCNEMFYEDNIDYETQKAFEIGYDAETNCITIPIRDEIGTLVGVKGRYFDKTLTSNKYIYLERCAKSKMLYGLFMSYSYIKRYGFVYVGESEKFCMQLWSMGVYNCVSTSGSKITKHQINKLASLGVKLIFCYDKDIEIDELEKIANKFPYGIEVFFMFDKDSILNEKESPSDNKEKWLQLQNNIYTIKDVKKLCSNTNCSMAV